jgi:hypothetical protein
MTRCWRSSKARKVLALLQLLAFLPSCTSWQVQPAASPRDLVTTDRPHLVRVTRADSSRAVLSDPSVQGDTLYGAPVTSDSASALRRTGVPLSDVKEIAVRRSDPTRTTLFIVGVGIALVSALCVADEFGCGPEDTDILD